MKELFYWKNNIDVACCFAQIRSDNKSWENVELKNLL